MTAVARLQHAMLYVTDLARSVDFYQEALGLEETWRDGPIALMRAVGSTNHHDLALLAVGDDAHRPPSGSVGLYHLAWEVWTIEELAAAATALSAMRALTGASDHGAIKSIYGRDPDGIEFEITWAVPRLYWGEYDKRGTVRPLDLDAELERWSRPTARA
jgi:catechol-2,3-dioxygenase